MRLKCSVAPGTVTLDFAKSFNERDAVRQVLDRLRPKELSPPGTEPALNSTAPSAPSAPVKPLSPEEMARRQALLARREVLKLHVQLVRGGAVPDDQFWNAMRFRYKDNGEPRGRGGLDDDDDANANDEVAAARRRGVPSDAFVIGDGGAEEAGGISASNAAVAKWTSEVPTSAQRHIVFMDKPAVARAYIAKVDKGTMTETQFWTLFTASSLVGARQRRRTKTDTARSAEADAIFAPYEAEERRYAGKEQAERGRLISRDLDLDHFDDHRSVHVLEGHSSAGGVPGACKDGRNSGFNATAGVRLGRMMNRHGLLVLDGAGVGGWDAEGVDVVRPLEDLQVTSEKTFSKLGVASVAELTGSNGNAIDIELDACRAMSDLFEDWNGDVSRFKSPVEGSAQHLDGLLKSMRP